MVTRSDPLAVSDARMAQGGMINVDVSVIAARNLVSSAYRHSVQVFHNTGVHSCLSALLRRVVCMTKRVCLCLRACAGCSATPTAQSSSGNRSATRQLSWRTRIRVTAKVFAFLFLRSRSLTLQVCCSAVAGLLPSFSFPREHFLNRITDEYDCRTNTSTMFVWLVSNLRS